MAELTDDARRDILGLVDHFARLDRMSAIGKLQDAVQAVLATADRVGTAGRSYPAIYTKLADGRHFWIRSHRYWFAYRMNAGEAFIVTVLFDGADIPGRFRG